MRFLKTWSLVGGGAILASVLGAAGGAMMARANRQADQENRGEDRLVAVERKLDSLLVWARIVSRYEGWPAPPESTGHVSDACPSVPGLAAAESP